MTDQKKLGPLLAAQDWEAAERLLRRLAKGKTAPPEVFYNLAKVLEAAGKPAQMAVWLRRAVALNPRYAIAWFELGRAALNANDLEQAYGAFQRAVDLDDKDADAQRNLGRIALRLGQWDKALMCLADQPDVEAEIALYRIKGEKGEPDKALRDRLLQDHSWRPEVIKMLTRTAKGSLPLRLPIDTSRPR